MAQSMEEGLLQAIQKDDIKAFNGFMEKLPQGAYRLGRFPVLSLLYLYQSRKILSSCEDELLKVTDCEELQEPVEISKMFSEKAGKCLRLYLNEVVSPLEMLLILDNTKRLKRVFPFAKPSASVKKRLQTIYSIKYSLKVKYEGDDIILEKRPLNYREKKRILTVCLCSVFAVAAVVGASVTAVALKPADGEVTKLRQIDFTSSKEYTLKRDIVLPENYSVEKVNCQINGEGHKLIFGKGAAFGEFNGKISNTVIESSGNTIFTAVSPGAVMENLTVNVNADISTAEGVALVVGANYGLIDGVTVNVTGKINALAGNNDGTQELAFSGLVLNNAYFSNQFYGIIQNCTVHFSEFTLVGEASANAAFGGVAGVNNSYLLGCKVTGKVTADTFDLGGVCLINSGVLSDNVNEADFSQVSANKGWNPIVSGIVSRNYYSVQSCENRGNISAVSACGEQGENELSVTAAGIAYLNGIEGVIERSKNSGAIYAEGGGTAYAGGIAAISYAMISGCLSNGEITVTAKNIYAGGIFASGEVTPYGSFIYFGIADSCISMNRISVTVRGDAPAYVGGIVGRIGELDGNDIGGGVTNCYFAGECASEVSYFGNIVGVCGANSYENNSYNDTNGEVRHNYAGNCYSENAFRAFGATVTGEETFTVVEDKGASRMSIEEIKNSQKYQEILAALEQ